MAEEGCVGQAWEIGQQDSRAEVTCTYMWLFECIISWFDGGGNTGISNADMLDTFANTCAANRQSDYAKKIAYFWVVTQTHWMIDDWEL